MPAFHIPWANATAGRPWAIGGAALSPKPRRFTFRLTLDALESVRNTWPSDTGTSITADFVAWPMKSNLATARPVGVRDTVTSPAADASWAVMRINALWALVGRPDKDTMRAVPGCIGPSPFAES